MHRLTIFFLLCAIAVVTVAAQKGSTCQTPRCRMACPHGYKVGKDGCAICSCKMGPCEEGQVPLKDYFCGRGPSRRDCPSTHTCIVAPNDSYAVCCPRRR